MNFAWILTHCMGRKDVARSLSNTVHLCKDQAAFSAASPAFFENLSQTGLSKEVIPSSGLHPSIFTHYTLILDCDSVQLGSELNPWKDGCVKDLKTSQFSMSLCKGESLILQACHCDSREVPKGEVWCGCISGYERRVLEREMCQAVFCNLGNQECWIVFWELLKIWCKHA